MFYPIRFKPLYKDDSQGYIWGGRNLERHGKVLPPDVKVAESWEVSCHPDGESIVSNGDFIDASLSDVIKLHKRKIIGNALGENHMTRFPLLVKFIDANDRLSVQVHPDDAYSNRNENGEQGKNEMWYILSAKPGARLIYGAAHGTTRESFETAIRDGSIESRLNYVDVHPGDVFNIPAGTIHGLGEGIVLAEIQQNSNITYRIYDYDRTDRFGMKRPLHIDKALDVIDFKAEESKQKYEVFPVRIGPKSLRTPLVSTEFFNAELYDVDGKIVEDADGSRFYIYIFTDGYGEISSDSGKESFHTGETIFIPAYMGVYSLAGRFKALRTYLPDI